MNKELIQMHIKEKNKQEFTNKKYDTFFDGKVLQICFYSIGCRFSKNGNCIMCDYGKSRKNNLTPNDIKEIIQKVFNNLNVQPKRIPKDYIDKVYLCWYGNRQLYYDGKPTILPICNQYEYDKLMFFYSDFNLHKDKKYRENLLNNIKL